MKKILLVLEFFFICTFLIIPPLLIKSGNFSSTNFGISWFTLINLVAAIYLFYAYETDSDAKMRKKMSGLDFLLNAGKVFLYFGILISISSSLNLISWLLKIPQINDSSQIKIDANIISCITSFFVSAFYEECLYRLYLPKILIAFFKRVQEKFFYRKSETFNKRITFIFRFLIEFSCILIFGFSHRYLGTVAVINAVLCGAVLRICYLKNNTVITGSLSHFIFNSFTLLSALL